METLKNIAASVSNTIFGSSDLTCEVWRIYVADGFSGAIHGDYSAMYELYFPELEMSLNTGIYTFDHINVMFGLKSRYLPKDPNKTIGSPKNPECLDIRCMTGADALRFRELAASYKEYQELEKDAIVLLKDTIKPLKMDEE